MYIYIYIMWYRDYTPWTKDKFTYFQAKYDLKKTNECSHTNKWPLHNLLDVFNIVELLKQVSLWKWKMHLSYPCGRANDYFMVV